MQLGQSGKLDRCHKDFLELVLSLAEQGKGEWRREARTLQGLKDFLIQVFKQKTPQPQHSPHAQPQHRNALPLEGGSGSGPGSGMNTLDLNSMKALAVAALSYLPHSFDGVFSAAVNHSAVPVRLAAVKALRRMHLDGSFLPKVINAVRYRARSGNGCLSLGSWLFALSAFPPAFPLLALGLGAGSWLSMLCTRGMLGASGK